MKEHYGNYVIHTVLDNWTEEEFKNLLLEIVKLSPKLSKLKYASNTIEKCLNLSIINNSIMSNQNNINSLCSNNESLSISDFNKNVVNSLSNENSNKTHTTIFLKGFLELVLFNNDILSGKIILIFINYIYFNRFFNLR